MQLYADTPVRRTRQVLGDLLLLGWCWAWVSLGMLLTEVIDVLAAGVDTLADGTGRLKTSFVQARDAAREIPIAGDELAAPLDSAARSGQALQQSGIELAGQIHTVAVVAGVCLALAAILPALAVHLARRWRWIRTAREVRAAAASETGEALLALRALVHTPLGQLRTLGPEPLAAWERGEHTRLASVELARVGLRLRAPHSEKPVRAEG